MVPFPLVHNSYIDELGLSDYCYQLSTDREHDFRITILAISLSFSTRDSRIGIAVVFTLRRQHRHDVERMHLPSDFCYCRLLIVDYDLYHLTS